MFSCRVQFLDRRVVGLFRRDRIVLFFLVDLVGRNENESVLVDRNVVEGDRDIFFLRFQLFFAFSSFSSEKAWR